MREVKVQVHRVDCRARGISCMILYSVRSILSIIIFVCKRQRPCDGWRLAAAGCLYDSIAIALAFNDQF
jgi:hypothetical protein